MDTKNMVARLLSIPFRILTRACHRLNNLFPESLRASRREQALLHEAFINSARSVPFRMAMADSTGTSVSFGSALTKAIAIADFCRRRWPDEDMVGVVLPASIVGALVNAGLLLAGKIPVNLNFTAGPDAFQSAMRQCDLKTVVTSRAFVEKVGLPADPAAICYAEDFRKEIGTWRAIKAVLKARLLPSFVLRRLYGCSDHSVNDVATVVFSSGATGEPKGVMLTHRNVMSNIEGMQQVFGLDRRDRICGVLPFFHSLGFTATLWFPLTMRVSAVYHPNPVEGRAIGALVREFGATVFLSTPTFLRVYFRSVLPGDFESLRLVIAGAENLPEELADRFKRKFGVRPLSCSKAASRGKCCPRRWAVEAG